MFIIITKKSKLDFDIESSFCKVCVENSINEFTNDSKFDPVNPDQIKISCQCKYIKIFKSSYI